MGQKLKLFSLVLLSAFCVFSLAACSTVKQAAKGILGVSTREVEACRKDALKKQFNYSYKDCYDKAMEILKTAGTYVYAQDDAKNMVALYVSETDTTVVGVFFTRIDAGHTQVEVSSPSTYAKESISEELFSGLDNSPKQN
jgi:hypothetical protein